jgi:hypothetical protein
MRSIFALALIGASPWGCAADALPIFDAHVHYSQEAWERMPPKEAIALLRKAGVKRALVSSTNDDGNQKVEHANWSRGWMADLPPAVAERIAYRNGEAIFSNVMKP